MSLTEGQFIVYKATSPSGKVYIGITSEGLEIRKNKHYRDALKFDRKFYKALRKYGSKVIWETIDTASTWNEACNKEKLHIQKYDSFKNGYNSTLGGEGIYGLKHPNPPMLGKTHTKEARNKIRIARLGKKCPESQKRAIRDSCKISVICLDTNHKLIQEFEAISDAARWLNISPKSASNINAVCKGKRNSAYGYIWKYKETPCL